MTDTTDAGVSAPASAPPLPSFVAAAVTLLARHGLTAVAGLMLARGLATPDQVDQLVNILVSVAVAAAGLGWSFLEKRQAFSRLVAGINAAPPLWPVLDVIFPRKPKIAASSSTVTIALDASDLIAEIRALAAKIDASQAPVATVVTTLTAPAAPSELAPDPAAAAAPTAAA
jgi:hypothetical protein